MISVEWALLGNQSLTNARIVDTDYNHRFPPQLLDLLGELKEL